MYSFQTERQYETGDHSNNKITKHMYLVYVKSEKQDTSSEGKGIKEK